MKLSKLEDGILTILFLLFIISIPFLIKNCDLKNGSTIINAYVVDVERCGRRSKMCRKYVYEYNGKTYYGKSSAIKLKVGEEFEIEVSVKNPEISYPK